MYMANNRTKVLRAICAGLAVVFVLLAIAARRNQSVLADYHDVTFPGSSSSNQNSYIIDPTQYGCHGDAQINIAVVPSTSGSAVLTAGSVFKASDVGKAIRLDDFTNFQQFWAGTITGFTDANTVTLSAGQSATVGHSYTATWGTADDTCLAAIATAMGNAAVTLRSTRVQFSYPVVQTTTWVLQSLSGEIWGAGCGDSQAAGGVGPSSPFIWIGTTPDIPMINRRASLGLVIRNMCLIGGSYAPPSFGIQDQQNLAQGDAGNVMNETRDTIIGNPYAESGITIAPPDTGAGFVGALSTAAVPVGVGTPMQLQMVSMPSTFNGPGPCQLIYLNDFTGFATVGSEAVRTKCCAVTDMSCTPYVRGANPILLNNTVATTHPSASTHVVIAQGPVNNGYGTEPFSTQDDKNHFDNVQVRNANVCASLSQGQTGGWYINGGSCNEALFGVWDTGGAAVSIEGIEFEGVGIKYLLSNTGAIHSVADNEQQGAALPLPTPTGTATPIVTYGPGFKMNDPGGVVKYLSSTLGTPTLTNFICDLCGIDLTSGANGVGDIINLGFGQYESVTFNNAVLVSDFNGGLNNTVNAQIHNYGGLAMRDVDISYASYSNQYIQVSDGGFADNRAMRTYHLKRLPKVIGTSPDEINYVLQGSASASDVHNEMDGHGWLNQTGMITVNQLGTAQNALAATCTGASGGTTDYWYHIAYSVNGQTQKANATGSKLTCVNAPSASTPISITASPPTQGGADTLNLYQATCSPDPCSDPHTEGLVASVPIGNQPSNSFGINTVQDTGTAPGAAMPTVDSTGMQQQSLLLTNPMLLAAAPACSAATKGLRIYITDDNSACTFGTNATGTGSTFCPVGCDGSNYKAGY